jgi:flagellar biosynthesis protein FlhA
LAIAAGILIILGCIPGMPHFIFLTMGGMLGVVSYYLSLSHKELEASSQIEDVVPETYGKYRK